MKIQRFSGRVYVTYRGVTVVSDSFTESLRIIEKGLQNGSII